MPAALISLAAMTLQHIRAQGKQDRELYHLRVCYQNIGEKLSILAGVYESFIIWTKELEERPKLEMMKEIVALEFQSSCAVLKRKRDRRMMIKLRGGTAAFQIEVGR